MDDEKRKAPERETNAVDDRPEEQAKTVEEHFEEDVDAVTGASPGTAQACSDLGLNSLEANLVKFNIKPPGVS